MQKPLEAERISQIEMQMQYRKAIPLSRSAYRTANLNPIQQIHNQAIQIIIHFLSK